MVTKSMTSLIQLWLTYCWSLIKREHSIISPDNEIYMWDHIPLFFNFTFVLLL